MGAMRWGILAVVVLLSGGCGSDMPFELAPIQGRVCYEDGSPIEAQSILVTFNPVVAATDGKLVAPGAQADVDVATGSFAGVTSRRPNDGVVLGKHKVVVVAFEPRADGRPTPSRAVPARYRKVATTPLEVDVESAGQIIELRIAKE